MLFIKGTKVILLSKYAPRFLADSTGEITASPTDRVSVRTFFSCWEVPIIRNSVNKMKLTVFRPWDS